MLPLIRCSARATSGAVRRASASGSGSFEPAPNDGIDAGERRSAIQITRRTSGCSTSSPHCSASSTDLRSFSSAGSSGGSGTRSSSARMIAREPRIFSPSSFRPGTVPPPNSANCTGLCATGGMSTRRYVDALELERFLDRRARVRCGDGVEGRGHGVREV